MDIDYNSHCYTFKKMNYANGFLDQSVDATYIIHLKDNGRLEHIYKQLEEYQPTKVVYIAFNLGYKKCQKKLIEQISYNDLTDAFLQCFKHSNEHGYENILILEDDFIFSPEIKNRENLDNINNFLNKKKSEEFVYYLGCNPILIAPCSFDLTQYKVFKACSTHSIIYSKNAKQKYNFPFEEKHWDVIVEKGIPNRYMYYKPLCYQTYPETENKQTWAEKDNIFIYYGKDLIIKLLSLDKHPEPGFTILYIFAKLIFIFLILSLITIIVLIICYIRYTSFTKITKKKYYNKK